MSRASLVYVVLVAVLVAGLWGVLRVGSGFKAPHDLSGDYKLEPPTPFPSLRIEQSGKYVRIAFGGSGPQLDLKWQGEEGAGDSTVTNLASGDWKVALGWEADSPTGLREVTLDGPGYSNVHVTIPGTAGGPTAGKPAPTA